MNVMLMALYRYQNYPVRIFHSMLQGMEGVEPHSVFLKNYFENTFSLPTPREEELFIEILKEVKPKLVGISVLSPYFKIAKRLTELIRENSEALVLWGGIHPTIAPESCISVADIVCVGEGEEALADLVECLKNNTEYSHIPNLWINRLDGVVKNPMRPLVQDMDSLPLPAYGQKNFAFIDNDRVRTDDPTLKYDIFFVMGSRGCPFSCSYCVNSLLKPLFKGLGKYPRRRSVDSILAEIKQDANVASRKYILFYDEIFGNEKQWLDEFILRYKKEVGLPFYIQYNPNMVKSMLLENIGVLVGSGLQTLNLGIQSGSETIRKQIYKRSGKNEDILKIANHVAQYGICINYDLIIENPYDTAETLKETIDLLLQLPKPLSFHLYSLQFFPKYPLTKRALEAGLISSEEEITKNLLETTTRNWHYIPKLIPCSRKQTYCNIIWLMVRNLTEDKCVVQAFSAGGVLGQFRLLRLSMKALFLYRFIGSKAEARWQGAKKGLRQAFGRARRA